MKTNFLIIALASVSIVACGSTVDVPVELSQEQLVLAEIVKSRQSNLKDLGAAFKAIGDELKAGRANSTTVEYSIKSVVQYAEDIEGWFPEGTGPDLGVEMKAKAEIWTDQAAFQDSLQSFKTAAAGLSDAGKDPASIAVAFRSVGGTCKSCHDNFKEQD